MQADGVRSVGHGGEDYSWDAIWKSAGRKTPDGFEVELAATPNENFDFAISAGYNDAKLASTLTSTSGSGAVSVVSGIEEDRRLPSVPELQAAASATYQWQVRAGSLWAAHKLHR